MGKIIFNIGYIFLGINFILSLILINKKMPRSFYVFTFYLFVILCIQILASYLKNLGINNLYLSHYYFILQFLLLSYFYYQVLENDFQKKIIKITVPLCLLILGIQYWYNLELFYKFNLFEIFITSFLLIIFAMFHFYNILNEKRIYYYINSGIFIYLFGSTFLFITGNLINTLTNDFRNIIWILNGFLYIIYQIYIFIELKQSFLNKKNE